MIKLLISILITILLIAFGIYHYGGNKTTDRAGDTIQTTSPSDAINGAKNAVQQTQNLQDNINSKAHYQIEQ